MEAPVEPIRGRPFVQDYGIDLQQVEGLLPWEWVNSRMEMAHNYWIGSTYPDGRPHVMPVWGLWLDKIFYFSTGRQSRKGRNLAANPHVVVHLESGDEVVILEGTVAEFSDPIFFQRFAEAYDAKYKFKPAPDPQNVFYQVEATVILAWKESDFVNSATRWQFRR